MNPLADFAAKIEQRVRESHGDVVNALFDHIDMRLGLIEAAHDKCSYAAALADYTYFKVSIHHAQKAIDMLYGNAAKPYIERLHVAHGRAQRLRIGMYDNICLSCPACLSRRSPWPLTAKFKDGRSVYHFNSNAHQARILQYDDDLGKWAYDFSDQIAKNTITSKDIIAGTITSWVR